MSRRLDEERIQGFVLCQGFCYIKNIRINNVATKTTFLQKNIVSFKNPAPSENSAQLIVSPHPQILKSSPQSHIAVPPFSRARVRSMSYLKKHSTTYLLTVLYTCGIKNSKTNSISGIKNEITTKNKTTLAT